MWTAFASVFSVMLGYLRVPYAAALDGNYFKAFARVHTEGRFPYVSLLALAAVAALFCFLSLADVIAGLVVIRITLQFLVQAIGLIVLRVRRPPAAAVPHVVVSAPCISGIRRILIRAHLAHELTHPDSLRRVDPDQRRSHISGARLASQGMAV